MFDISLGPHLYLARAQSLRVANFREYYCLWSLKKIMWGIFFFNFFFIEKILMCISLKENLRIQYNPSMAGGEDSSSLIQILLCYINHLLLYLVTLFTHDYFNKLWYMFWVESSQKPLISMFVWVYFQWFILLKT